MITIESINSELILNTFQTFVICADYADTGGFSTVWDDNQLFLTSSQAMGNKRIKIQENQTQ